MRVKAFILAVAVAAVIAGSLPVFLRFTITDRTGKMVFQDRAERYKEFYISFTHSVNRTPVNEYYRIFGDRFILEKATFYSYGAGMPETGEYGSSKPSIKDGLVRVEDINKEFKRFTYIAGTYANHSLRTGSREIFFSKLVKPQSSITFEVKRISLFTILRLYGIGDRL
jgi:hypothetical protein